MAGDTKAWLDAGKVIVFYSKRLVIKEAVNFRDLIRALTAEGFKDVIVDLSACSVCHNQLFVSESVSARTP